MQIAIVVVKKVSQIVERVPSLDSTKSKERVIIVPYVASVIVL